MLSRAESYISTLVSGLKKWIACLTVQHLSPAPQVHQSLAHVALPETRLCTESGIHSYEESMTDCLPTLDGMTIFRTLSQRRNGTRRPIGNGLASVTYVATSGCTSPLCPGGKDRRGIGQTFKLNKLRLQNIHRPLAGRNGRPLARCIE